MSGFSRTTLAAAAVTGVLSVTAAAFGHQPEPGLIPAAADQRHQIYAPPMIYGPWRQIAAHGGPVAFDISVTPVGDTQIVGEVRYTNRTGEKTVDRFIGDVSIRTGNVWDKIEVRLKGVPTGSSCYVDVSG